MPLPIESVVSAAPSLVAITPDGVAFAEVSPDFRFCINTRRYRSAVFTASGGIRYCYVGGVYARRVGMGAA